MPIVFALRLFLNKETIIAQSSTHPNVLSLWVSDDTEWRMLSRSIYNIIKNTTWEVRTISLQHVQDPLFLHEIEKHDTFSQIQDKIKHAILREKYPIKKNPL